MRTGPGTAFGGVAASSLENALGTNSLKKFFGYSQLRIGWLLEPEAFIERKERVIRYFSEFVRSSRHLARQLFADYEHIVERYRARIREQHPRLVSR